MKKLTTLIVTSLLSLSAHAGFAVVGNPAGIDALSKADVKKLFLGKKTQLPNGKTAAIVELKDGDAQRVAFHDLATGRSESQLQSAWSRLVFTGKAEAPIQVADFNQVLSTVSSNPNAIGYIDDAMVDGSVKVLFKF
ncbi:phosphate ABC transporter substrate-binding protein [Vibrio hippocampi]|uniref:Phosphate ABC transporter substrate-binding protein n=1 Tax=Vibrio hippocampi TaxID=654686 RepID=A0ABM8ZM18_9VIBR|nr:phosphate ABC transporter substrate-binding protein [Vibrio hippocampi]CAH0529545.1 hypothetical protein VHP8226_03299 [Vibrio hippocampi]